MQLNRDQAQVVDEEGHCLVVACPGSGKTRVITEKIASLFERHPKARICAVTFTRDSAQELTERVVESIGQEKFNRFCRIGTFHALAIRQLKMAGVLGSLASPAQQIGLVGRAMSACSFDGAMDEAIPIIEAAKTALADCEAHNHPLYVAYQELLKRQKLVDLYDVLRDAVLLMRDGRVNPYPAKFMLVDEFQDTDHVQLAWVLEHFKAGTAITCVGDDDQSIYAWRGALGNAGMMEFKNTCDAKLITLGQNYRSHQEILSVADAIIRADTARIPKTLEAAKGNGGKVKLLRFGTWFDEAEHIADMIQSIAVPINDGQADVFAYTVPPHGCAILARSRRYLDFIESELQVRRIRFRRPASESLWSRPPFLQLLTMLKSLQSGSPDGVDSALHHGLTAKLGATAANNVMATLHRLAGNTFSHILDGRLPEGLKGQLLAPEFDLVTSFAKLSAGWRLRLAAGNYRLVINGVAGWLSSFESDPDKVDLIERMGEFLSGLQGTLLKRVNLASQVNKKAGGEATEEDRDGVVLTTMHAAKGLEFDNVWVIGCNDGIIPSPKSGNLPEERRLLYVAVTRARANLHISATTKTNVSPLLTEVGIVIGAGN